MEFIGGMKDYFEDLVCGKWRMVSDERYPTDEEERDTVISLARGMIGNQHYNVFSSNCEHFVTELLLGKHISHQSDRL